MDENQVYVETAEQVRASFPCAFFAFIRKTLSYWLVAHWQSSRDSMTSKGNAVGVLATTKTCSSFTLKCKGVIQFPADATMSMNMFPLERGKESMSWHYLCLLNQREKSSFLEFILSFQFFKEL